MSKRYYIVPIIEEQGEFGPAFRPKVPAGVNYVAEFKTDPDTGRPALPWALVLVSAGDHRQLLEDPEIDPLPDFPKDAKVSAMHKPTRDGMDAALARRGIPDVGTVDGYREVLRAVGRHLNPNFHEDNFDLA